MTGGDRPMARTPTVQEIAGIAKILRDEHRQILALFQLYLAAEADSRRPIVDQILQRLDEHFIMEEGLLGEGVRQQHNGASVLQQVRLDHEEIQAMMCELRQAETDDDESMDEFFADMMQTVHVHFTVEERDLLPLLAQQTSQEQ